MTTVTLPTVHAKRIGPTLSPDRSRVLMRPFQPRNDAIARRIVARVLALIGAHFTHECSPESAALFNPYIVPHPDQAGLPKGALRFILSLRATGQGHISTITFRTGTVSAQHRITRTPRGPFVTEPERVPNAACEKALFGCKHQEAGVQNDFCQRCLANSPTPSFWRTSIASWRRSAGRRTRPMRPPTVPCAASCCWPNRTTK